MEHSESHIKKNIQPFLLGLMDGSVSTLAPIFAAAFATHDPNVALIVGMSASTGAGISMAFAEGMSDDGALTGRGHPVRRGLLTGFMTFVGGALHTLPFLLSNLDHALYLAYIVVIIELIAISYIRYKYLRTNFLTSCIQVIVGGTLVFLSGYFIGQW